jgi:hypothetical protein
MDILQIDAPEGVLGSSLLPEIRGREVDARPALLELTKLPAAPDAIQDQVSRHYSLILSGLKLIHVQVRQMVFEQAYVRQGEVLEERFELYDLKADPAEREDLSELRQDLLQLMVKTKEGLSEQIKAMRQKFEPSDDSAPLEIPDYLKEQLEQLGY